jgi:hypothetical protein
MSGFPDGVPAEKTFQGLLGNGVLAIWNGIAPDDEAEFNNWYTHQHVPERVGTPGFLRARRYLALEPDADPDRRYFCLYETESLETLTSPGYLKRLDNPSDWTSKIVPLFVNGNRTACRVTASLGQGVGGLAAALELGPQPGRDAELRSWLTGAALPELLGRPEVVAAHLCESDPETTRAKDQTEESRGAGFRETQARWVLVVEAIVEPGLDAAQSTLCGPAGLAAHGAAPDVSFSRYRLLYSLSGTP